MKKNRLFKFGAGLTAALMVCGSVGMVAFADEDAAAKDAAPETGIVDVVDNETTDPAEPADPADENADPVETTAPEATPAPEDEATPAPEASADPAESADPDTTIPAEEVTPAPEVAPEVNQAAGQIGEVTFDNLTTETTGDNIIKVSFDITTETAKIGDQMTLFAYDVAAITNPETPFVPEGEQTTATPVMHIDQMSATQKVTFKILVKGEGFENGITGDNKKDLPNMLLKVGGSSVETPGALIVNLKDVTINEAPDFIYGNVYDEDDVIDIDDVNVLMRIIKKKITQQSDSAKWEFYQNAGDVYKDDVIDIDDVNVLMRVIKKKIAQESLPVIPD